MFYPQNNPRVTRNMVNCGFTLMNSRFGESLQKKLDEAGIKPAELARRSGVTKQNIGRLLNNTPHPVTGAPPKTEPETVEKLARALGWDINDALDAAGFASTIAVPEPIRKIGFDGFTDEKIAKIADYMRLLRLDKEAQPQEQKTGIRSVHFKDLSLKKEEEKEEKRA